MKFKKGDKVVYVKNKFVGRWPHREEAIPLGSIGKITRYVENQLEGVPYYVENGRIGYWYHADELELVQGCLMKRIKPPK